MKISALKYSCTLIIKQLVKMVGNLYLQKEPELIIYFSKVYADIIKTAFTTYFTSPKKQHLKNM